MSDHPNSVLAAATHDRRKARADRRLICETIANHGAGGCSDEDLARLIPSIHPNSLRIRRGELQDKPRADGYTGYGFITDSLGVNGTSVHGKRVTMYHITLAGLVALGRDPAEQWHSETKAT